MFRKRERGQSLIEVTFFLIILLILVAGIVEVGAILQTKLTVVNSAREGARFGTVGASDEDITLVTQTSASNVINFSPDDADIWVIRAKTDDSGEIDDACPANIADAKPSDSYWCVSHEVGGGPEEPTFFTYDMVANATDGLLYGIDDTEYIAVAVSYDHQSVIGLPYAVGGGGMPVNSYTLMRVESNEDYAGCMVWPIAIHKDRVNWDAHDLQKGTLLDDIIIGGGSGNFGWLSWNGDVDANTLRDNLTTPANSLSQYTNAANSDDHRLSAGDWVYGSTGWVQTVDDEVEDLAGQYIRILVYDDTAGDDDPPNGTCLGQNCSYHVIGFAIVALTGDMDASSKSISAHFIGFDESCQ
jgi:hypothetical protein